MKRTFLAKRNALLSSRSASRGAVVLGVVLVLVLARLIVPDLFWGAFAPVFRAADAVAAGSRAVAASFAEKEALVAANDRLVASNAALANENLALTQKVASLTALLGTAQKPVAGVVAGVVARPPESPYDALLVAAGAEEGVTLGMEAFGPGGSPVGVVSSVFARFSRVTLFSAPGVSLGGWVGRANVPLTLQGAGGGAIRANVPSAAGIVEGDTVFAPGPGALPVGTVVRVDSDPLSPGETLRIAPATNLFSLTEVELRATGVVPLSFATTTAL